MRIDHSEQSYLLGVVYMSIWIGVPAESTYLMICFQFCLCCLPHKDDLSLIFTCILTFKPKYMFDVPRTR